MLYGDNGCGKTTILSLLFALLAPQLRAGHRGYIRRTPFKRFTIYFDDGASVSAEKKAELVGAYSVCVAQNQSERTYHLTTDARGIIEETPDLLSLVQHLRRFSPAIYFLPDDRRVRSTLDDDGENPDELSPVRAPYRYERYLGEQLSLSSRDNRESHHLNINPVLDQTNFWFRKHALQGTSTGEENATSIYLRVVEQINRLGSSSTTAPSNQSNGFIDRLNALAREADAFAQFGLLASFPASEFITTIREAGSAARNTITTVLEPYVDGMEARLNALKAVRDLIATYVDTTNSFLTNKSLSFTLGDGVVIRGYGGDILSPALLSSGEKQLILLLSNTILARDSGGIFIIDEPELSLNVKWQRRLVDALLQCSQGANIQYILASHSLELITLHRANTVELVSS